MRFPAKEDIELDRSKLIKIRKPLTIKNALIAIFEDKMLVIILSSSKPDNEEA